MELLPLTLGCVLIGLIAYYLGYYSGVGRDLSRRLPALASRWNSARLPGLLAAYVAIGLAALGTMILQSGGLRYYLLHLYDINEILLGKQYLFIVAKGFLLYALMFSEAWSCETGRPGYRIMSLALLSLTLIASLFFGFRGIIALVFICPIIVRRYLGGPGISGLLVGFGLLIVIVLPVYSRLRTLSLPSGSSVAMLIAQADSGIEYSDIPVLLFQREYGIESLTLVLQQVGRTVPAARGRTLLSILTEVIPRGLWADKPLSIGFEFTTTFMARNIYGKRLVSSISTLPGELYWNFLWPGVIIGMLLTGIASSTADEYLAHHLGKSSVLLHVAMLMYFAAINEGGIAGHMVMDLLSFAIPAVAGCLYLASSLPQSPADIWPSLNGGVLTHRAYR